MLIVLLQGWKYVNHSGDIQSLRLYIIVFEEAYLVSDMLFPRDPVNQLCFWSMDSRGISPKALLLWLGMFSYALKSLALYYHPNNTFKTHYSG